MNEPSKFCLYPLLTTGIALLRAEAAFRIVSGKIAFALMRYRAASVVLNEFPKSFMSYDPWPTATQTTRLTPLAILSTSAGWSSVAAVRLPGARRIRPARARSDSAGDPRNWALAKRRNYREG
jgi:hypothetical protein